MDIALLLQLLRDYGLPIVAIALLILGILVPGWLYKQEKAEKDEAYARVDRFIDLVEAVTGIKAPAK